jgi:hypothetical protein
MHTYITDGQTYTVGFLMVQKSNGTQSFVPLIDVGTLTDATIAVNALNGGDANALQRIAITKEYTEGVTPQPTK